jgi:uncharacterized protein YjbI with pentapeptide repeats
MRRKPPLEQEMIDAAVAGTLVDRGEGRFSPTEMRAWGEDRTVRAEVLRCLLTEPGRVAAKGVRLRGIKIKGELDLQAVTLRCPLRLESCFVEGPRPDFSFATVSLLELKHCHLAGLAAESLVVRKDLDLTGSTLTQPIQLEGAEITGWLVCTDTQLQGANEDGFALIAFGLKVGGGVALDKDFRAAGAIDLRGADIQGQLKCTGAHLDGKDSQGRALTADRIKVGRGVLLSDGFTAAGAIRLAGANITSQLTLRGAQLNGRDESGNALTAFTMNVGGDVILEEPFTAAGGIEIRGSDIAGQLRCKGAKLSGRNEEENNALLAYRMKVGSDAYLDGVFTQNGGIRLTGTDIAGRLSFRGAHLNGTDIHGNALYADSVRVGGRLIIGDGFIAAGTVRLPGANIVGRLHCHGARFNGSDKDGRALLADQMTVGGGVAFDDVCTERGAIRMVGADITGNLDCKNVHLKGADSDSTALIADSLKVRDRLTIDSVSTTTGAIRLPGAKIPGRLQFGNVKLKGRDNNGRALLADGITVGGGVWFGGVRTTRGAIRMVGADITGDLRYNAVRLNGTDEHDRALVANRIKVSSSVILGPGEKRYGSTESIAAGTVSFRSAHIGGSLELKIKKLPKGREPGGKQKVAVDLAGAQITGDLAWGPGQAVGGEVILTDAKAGQLKDELGRYANGYWPSATAGLLFLDGFTYNRICWTPEDTPEKRLEWIGSPYKRAQENDQRVFTTQPYEQLQAVYRESGQDTEARKVAIARRRDLRRYGDLTTYHKALNWLLDNTIRYGYRVWHAVVALAVLYVAAVVIYFAAQHSGLMIPTTQPKSGPAPTAMHCTGNYPCFYPAAYAIDTVIPLINVRQAAYWTPNGQTPGGHALGIFTWVSTVFGWVLATLAVAGYTGLVRRD